MADTGEKTEPATPRRRGEARARGHVPRSADLSAAVMLLTGFVALELWGGRIGEGLLQVMRRGLESPAPWDVGSVPVFAEAVVTDMLKRLLPFLLILLAVAMAIMFAQIGPLLTFQPITPSFGKINPISGFQRLFSAASWVTAATGLAKLAVLGIVVYVALAGSAASIAHAFLIEHGPLFMLGSRLTIRLGVAVSAAFLVLALLDYGWQRYRYDRNLRMTKEEVKDELRSMEGDPAIKRRRRQIQMQLAMQRLKKDVPRADVVVTNPTHVAVAIAYDGESMVAPKVVAKGADYVALRIRQIAQEWGIPIVERRALARALYESVEVGQYVPERFYTAIAEILAYVYELTGRWKSATANRRNESAHDSPPGYAGGASLSVAKRQRRVKGNPQSAIGTL